MELTKPEQKHFVLVHGGCHGAWCWYKVKPLLESAGHRVTVFDLAASGIDSRQMYEGVRTFRDYSEPLFKILESIPNGEKVVLVGHSLGGINLGFAMENFPGKIAVAVFMAAFMPDAENRPSYVLEQYLEAHTPKHWLDTEFKQSGEHFRSFLFGPEFLALKLYQLCPIHDLELAKSLVRPTSFFVEDLANIEKFSKDKFGSVKKVYLVTKEDLAISEEFQRWIIRNGGVKDVWEIHGADHMAMISTPEQLCTSLLQIAHKLG